MKQKYLPTAQSYFRVFSKTFVRALGPSFAIHAFDNRDRRLYELRRGEKLTELG